MGLDFGKPTFWAQAIFGQLKCVFKLNFFAPFNKTIFKPCGEVSYQRILFP